MSRVFSYVARTIALTAALATATPFSRAQVFDDPDLEVARKHFKLGSERYAANDYANALAEFELAKRAKPSPALDFNIARCLDRLERYPEAIAAYRHYVTASPNAADAASVRERIAVLEQRVPATPAPVVPNTPPPVVTPPVVQAPPSTSTTDTITAPPPATPSSSSSRKYLVPGVLTGVTGATLITGGALLGVLASKYNHANGPNGCRPCTDGEIAPLRRYQAAGFALMGISGALLVVDVALFVVAAKKK